MAKLVLDFQVKNVKKAKNSVEEVTNEVKKAKKVVERISASDGYSKLASNAAKTVIPLRKMTQQAYKLAAALKEATKTGFDDITVHAKTLLKLESELNSEIERQASLRAKIAVNSKSGSNAERSLVNQIKYQKKKTKELEKQAKELGIITSESKKESAAAKKAAREAKAYWAARKKAIAEAQKKTADYWMAVIRWQKKAKNSSPFGSGSALKLGSVAGITAGLTSALVTGVSRAISSLVAKISELGRAGVASFFNINKEVEQTKILLGTALGDDNLGEKMFGNILKMAEKMPFSIKEISDSFVKLKTAGLEDTAEKVRILGDAISAFGGTDEDLHLATIAIQQMAGKGVVSMEELRRQLGERVPTVIRNFAEELGKSYKDLTAQISKGALEFDKTTQDALFAALNRHAGASEKRMNSMVGAVVTLRNSWTKLMVDVGESNGLFKKLSEVIRAVAANLTAFSKTKEGKKLIDDLTKSANNFIKVLKDPRVIVRAFESIKAIMGVVLDVFTVLIKAALKFADTLDFDTPEVNINTPRDQRFVQRLDVKTNTQKILEEIENIRTKFKNISQDVEGDPVEVKVNVDDGKAKLELLEKGIENISQVLEENKEVEFDLKLKLTADKYKNKLILSEVEAIKKAAEEAGTGSIAGYKRQVTLLERAKSLLEQMDTTGRKVSKQEVLAAKQRWEYQQRITRGGKSAYGTAAKAYKEAYAEYTKLLNAYKTGEKIVDNDAAKKQKSLLQDIYKIQLEGISKLREKSDKLSEERDALLEVKKGTEEISDTVDKTGKAWTVYGDKVVSINKTVQQSLKSSNKYIEEQIRLLEKMQAKSSSGSTLPGRASGGPVTAGKSYIVGEKGQEIFTPNTSGYITPNHMINKTNRMVDINLNLGDGLSIPLQGTESSLNELERKIAERRRYAA